MKVAFNDTDQLGGKLMDEATWSRSEAIAEAKNVYSWHCVFVTLQGWNEIVHRDGDRPLTQHACQRGICQGIRTHYLHTPEMGWLSHDISVA